MTTKLLTTHCHSTNVRVCETRKSIVHTLFGYLWKFTPTLSKLIAKRMFFTPSTYRISPVEKHYLDTARSFEMSVHHKTVKCWEWGNGPSVLLAHGWNGRGIQLHRFIEPLISVGYSVIAYDAPGHGESQGNTSSYFEFADTIRTLLTSSNGHDIQGVIAYSLGASATVNCIAKENHTLKTALIAPALRLAEVLYSFFDDFGIPRPLYRNLIEEYENRFGYNMERDNPSNLLKEIESKILIVHDKNDSTIPYIDSKKLSDELQNIELHTTESLGHKGVLTNSSVIDLIISNFTN